MTAALLTIGGLVGLAAVFWCLNAIHTYYAKSRRKPKAP